MSAPSPSECPHADADVPSAQISHVVTSLGRETTLAHCVTPRDAFATAAGQSGRTHSSCVGASKVLVYGRQR
eukprot:scaffold133670_cov35-Tisochrysis_lutea.AAC.2